MGCHHRDDSTHPYRIHYRTGDWYRAEGNVIHAHNADEAALIAAERFCLEHGRKIAVQSLTCDVFKLYTVTRGCVEVIAD